MSQQQHRLQSDFTQALHDSLRARDAREVRQRTDNVPQIMRQLPKDGDRRIERLFHQRNLKSKYDSLQGKGKAPSEEGGQRGKPRPVTRGDGAEAGRPPPRGAPSRDYSYEYDEEDEEEEVGARRLLLGRPSWHPSRDCPATHADRKRAKPKPVLPGWLLAPPANLRESIA